MTSFLFFYQHNSCSFQVVFLYLCFQVLSLMLRLPLSAIPSCCLFMMRTRGWKSWLEAQREQLAVVMSEFIVGYLVEPLVRKHLISIIPVLQRLVGRKSSNFLLVHTGCQPRELNSEGLGEEESLPTTLNMQVRTELCLQNSNQALSRTWNPLNIAGFCQGKVGADAQIHRLERGMQSTL